MQKLVPLNPNLGRKQGNFLFVEIRTPPPTRKKCALKMCIFGVISIYCQPNLTKINISSFRSYVRVALSPRGAYGSVEGLNLS